MQERKLCIEQPSLFMMIPVLPQQVEIFPLLVLLTGKPFYLVLPLILAVADLRSETLLCLSFYVGTRKLNTFLLSIKF